MATLNLHKAVRHAFKHVVKQFNYEEERKETGGSGRETGGQKPAQGQSDAQGLVPLQEKIKTVKLGALN